MNAEAIDRENEDWRAGYNAAARNEPLDPYWSQATKAGWYAQGARTTFTESQLAQAAEAGFRG